MLIGVNMWSGAGGCGNFFLLLLFAYSVFSVNRKQDNQLRVGMRKEELQI